MRRLFLFSLVSTALAVVTFMLQKPNTYVEDEGVLIPREWTASNASARTPSQYRRRVDQAILSIPEWYLVFSPREQAQYFKHSTASTFPYMRQNAQIWDIHRIVKLYTDTNYTDYRYNGEYQLMIYIINFSCSAEYLTKGWYERVVGRLTDTKTVETDEDAFAARYTADYVSFINDNFWYEFDFADRLQKLWTETSFYDDHFLRKLERKYFLTSELVVKWGYGKLIKMGAQTMHGPDDTSTAVMVHKLPSNDPSNLDLIKTFPDGSALVRLNRYARFAEEVDNFAQNGAEFEEIAGNNAALFVSVIIPSNKFVSTDYTENIFSQPIPSEPGKKRVVVAVLVKDLNRFLLSVRARNFDLEHVFDY